MTPAPPGPVIYEIPTRVWLESLRADGADRPPTLAEVPEAEWDRITSFGFDAVWLMGVWERSATACAIARAHADLAASYRDALPDLQVEDIIGSPYAVRNYAVDAVLGGDDGLADARMQLRRRGVRLILDFIPNHVARDHPWVSERPELLVLGDPDALAEAPDDWYRAADRVIAHGRDPYFPGWTDTAQVNVFAPGAAREAARVLASVAARCDGVRCDMAMLVTRDIFARTWKDHVGEPPATEYWPEVLGAVRARYPQFVAIAEAYWDTENLLRDQGFDLVYDKTLYDRLVAGDPTGVRNHLEASGRDLRHRVHFTENHDEPRAAATWSPVRSRTVSVVAFTVPGAKLLHDGQIEGARVRSPVQLRRRVREPQDREMAEFLRTLLVEIRTGPYRDGTWRLLAAVGWPGDDSARNLLAWSWDAGEESRRIVVVNLSDFTSRGRVALPWGDLGGRSWRLRDRFGESYLRGGDEMRSPGLYVELPPDGFHVLAVRRP